MASGGAIRAGRAFVELFADDSRLTRGLKAARAKLKAFGESVRNMGLKLAGLGAAATLAGVRLKTASLLAGEWAGRHGDPKCTLWNTG